MLPWLALLPTAVAAPLEVAVSGLGDARAVHALVSADGQVTWADCNDAGVGADDAVDGIWRCGGTGVIGPEARIALLVDGRLKAAGAASWSGSARTVSIRVDGGSLGLSTAADLTAPTAGALAAGPGHTLIVRIPDFDGAGAPVLRLQGASTSVELNCGDDGRFPDRERNDLELACAGPTPPGPRLLATLLPPGGAQVELGEVVVPEGPMSQWRLDLAAATLAQVDLDAPRHAFAGPSDLPEDPLSPKERGVKDGGPPPEAAGGDGGEGPPPAPPASDPGRPAAQTQTQPQTQGGGSGSAQPTARAPAHRSLPDSGVLAFGLAAVAVAGGVAVGRRRGARRDPLAPLAVVPAPPLFEGGPALSDAGAWLKSAAPAALAQALAPDIAATRRLVVASTAALALPPTRGASAYAVVQPHIDDLADAIAALAARPGPELAVLLVGDAPLLTPGEIGPDAALELERRLPAGVFLGVLVGPEAPPSAWLPRFTVEGPPWRGARA